MSNDDNWDATAPLARVFDADGFDDGCAEVLEDASTDLDGELELDTTSELRATGPHAATKTAESVSMTTYLPKRICGVPSLFQRL